jgi:hypothetical protein
MKTNKKTIIILLSLSIVIILLLLVSKASNKRQELENAIIKEPALPFLFIKKAQPKQYKQDIINYFNPNCEICQNLIADIIKNRSKLYNSHIILVSNAPLKDVIAFKSYYQLDSLPFFSISIDTAFLFQKTFGHSETPSFFVYQNKKLVKKIIGETKIENLLPEP